MTSNVVGIVCALAVEARALGPAQRRGVLAELPDGSLLAVSGMGAAAAARGAEVLARAGATALASWGMAGGLDPRLAPGAIFLPSEVVVSEGRPIQTAYRWRQRLGAALEIRQPITEGKLLTASRAVASSAEKAALFHATGAAAVDMESWAVGEVAQTHRLSFIVVRVIVDGAADALPGAVAAAADASGHLRLWRLLGALALAPAELAPLLRLARRYRTARRSLAAVARAGAWPMYAFAGAPGTANS